MDILLLNENLSIAATKARPKLIISNLNEIWTISPTISKMFLHNLSNLNSLLERQSSRWIANTFFLLLYVNKLHNLSNFIECIAIYSTNFTDFFGELGRVFFLLVASVFIEFSFHLLVGFSEIYGIDNLIKTHHKSNKVDLNWVKWHLIWSQVN